jgi:hypothetical protein
VVKRLLNYEEELTNERLKDLCKKYGTHVFVKVRLADIFPVEGSGIREEAYRFALQSHLDFVITDKDLNPLFGVEYDGPYHTAPTQQERDAVKMDLCKRFKFPLLRVNARYLLERRAGLDLLGWFITPGLRSRPSMKPTRRDSFHQKRWLIQSMCFPFLVFLGPSLFGCRRRSGPISPSVLRKTGAKIRYRPAWSERTRGETIMR